MKTLRSLFHRPGRAAATRLDRYYAGVARPGVGYPTADEARRDLVRWDRSTNPFGWVR